MPHPPLPIACFNRLYLFSINFICCVVNAVLSVAGVPGGPGVSWNPGRVCAGPWQGGIRLKVRSALSDKQRRPLNCMRDGSAGSIRCSNISAAQCHVSPYHLRIASVIWRLSWAAGGRRSMQPSAPAPSSCPSSTNSSGASTSPSQQGRLHSQHHIALCFIICLHFISDFCSGGWVA